MRMDLEVQPAGTATATVVLTQEQVDRLRGRAGRGRVPLAITFRGSVFRTSISVYRGQWMMVVNRAMRDAGMVPGARYRCDVRLDAEERSVEVPADLAKALRAAGVHTAFDALSYTRRKEHVRQVEDAKRPETRTRRIAAIIEALSS